MRRPAPASPSPEAKFYPVASDVLRPELFGGVNVGSTSGGGVVLVYDKATSEKISALLAEIDMLSKRMAAIESNFDDTAIVELRDLSDSDATTEIRDFFETRRGEVLYPSDVAGALALDYHQAKKIIEALEQEGVVGKTEEEESN